jgi:hypothetical protein
MGEEEEAVLQLMRKTTEKARSQNSKALSFHGAVSVSVSAPFVVLCSRFDFCT